MNRAIDELRGHHKAVSEDVELSVAYSDLLGSLDDFQARLRSEVYEPALGFETVDLRVVSAESFLELIDQAARGELEPDPEPTFEWEEELERRFAIKLHALSEVLSELGDRSDADTLCAQTGAGERSRRHDKKGGNRGETACCCVGRRGHGDGWPMRESPRVRCHS